METNFSIETTKWLGHWLSGGADASDVPAIVHEELNKLMEEMSHTKIRVFRGLTPEDHVLLGRLTFAGFSSWTHDIEIAHSFGDVVVSCDVDPTEVLIDTTLIDPNFIMVKCSGFPEEKEVILNPGTYDVTMGAELPP